MESEVKEVSGVNQKPLCGVFLGEKSALSPYDLSQLPKGNSLAGHRTTFKICPLDCALVDILENSVTSLDEFPTAIALSILVFSVVNFACKA